MHPRSTEAKDPSPVASVNDGEAAPVAETPTARPKVIGIAVVLSLLVGVLVTAFAWPASETNLRDVPIAVVGPPEAAGQIQHRLDAAVPDGFALEAAPDVAAAEELITERDVYGAIVLDGNGPPKVMTASAASPVVAQALEGIAIVLAQEASGAPGPNVENVVSLPDADPRGVGLSAAILPMVIGGMIVGYGMIFGVTGIWRRVGGALAAAVGAGLVATLVVQTWLGSIVGDYAVNAGVIAMIVAAISLALVGLNAVMGYAGLAVGALVMLLLGNPLSGVSSAPEMLPAGWSELGQLLPAGAGGALLRSAAFFDSAAASVPLLVLSCWIVGGILLVAMQWTVDRRRRTSTG